MQGNSYDEGIARTSCRPESILSLRSRGLLRGSEVSHTNVWEPRGIASAIERENKLRKSHSKVNIIDGE